MADKGNHQSNESAFNMSLAVLERIDKILTRLPQNCIVTLKVGESYIFYEI
jgi:hypothetical protein